LELLWLLQQRSDIEIRFATSDRFAGRACADLHPGLLGCFVSHNIGLDTPCDVVFLATPPDASKGLVAALPSARIIDLSNAHRFDDKSIYGLLPCFTSEQRHAQLIANPGCYATAAILALAPLASLIEPSVIIDAASGTTGAGRRASEDYSLSELHDDLFAYKVLNHAHTPEIANALHALSGQHFEVTFTPKLLPIRRGILATAYARLKNGDARKAFKEYYADQAFIRLEEKAEQVRLRRVVGTNDVLLHIAVDDATGRVVVQSALDNLLKGAAGQAMENMNLAFGLPRTTGLQGLKVQS